MKTSCINCKKEVEAKEEIQKCKCGMYYGLTPFFTKSKDSPFIAPGERKQ